MSQRGFTLLEMMLVLLLIGVSASMVLLAFPSARTQEATQILARFQAQLDFVRERGQQTGQLFGIVIHPDRWQFMRLQPADEGAPAAADDRWGNAQWLPLQAGRATTAETLPRARLTLRFPNGQAWTPGEQPDVIIFPGGVLVSPGAPARRRIPGPPFARLCTCRILLFLFSWNS